MRIVVNGCKEKAQWDMKKNKTGNILQIDFLKKIWYNIYIRYEKESSNIMSRSVV